MNIILSRKNWLLLVIAIIIPCCFYKAHMPGKLPIVKTVEELRAIFPTNSPEIEGLAQQAISNANKDLEAIYSIKDNDRTFYNTAYALDRAFANFSIKLTILYLLSLVSPDDKVRNSAHEQVLMLQNFFIDNFGQNKRIYNALCEYNKLKASDEKLTEPQLYFIRETIESYRQSGISKSDEIREQIKDLGKKLAVHGLNFEKNIAQDNRFITVDRNGLSGIDDDFIECLKKDDNGKYKLCTDYPTYFKIIEECSNENTRKELWKAFVNRGYPANQKELEKVIALRDKLAQLTDFKSYADLDIDNQMAKTPEHVEAFLNNLIKRCEKKVKQENAQLKSQLPEDIKLVNGKFNPWDIPYLKNSLKKRLDINESEIANYFPLDYTLPKLFYIYESFFGLKFNKVNIKCFWHEDVEMLAVYKDGVFIGSVLLDLFPRENKYSHACQVSIIPAVKEGQVRYPAVVAVIANFPKATERQPSLLKRTDVVTFFHEFGHAIHSLLGATELATQAGPQVKGDFVEMPSQMLEEWMWDKAILKMVSNHYKTHESLPADLIEKIEKLKQFDSGNQTQRQICFAFTSLNYYKSGAEKNLFKIWKELHQNLRPDVVFYDDDHGYCSFIHLIGYGAKYYGYLWSKVFALDLFEHIKPMGLLNNSIGQKYTNEVIGKGGSQDPEELLRNFLGREPNSDAFFKDLGVLEI